MTIPILNATMRKRGVAKMLLFSNETINISKIYTVNMYETDKNFITKPTKYYSTNVCTYELIFYLSGKRCTTFGDKTFDDIPNTIRYLPKGNHGGSYSVTTNEPGKCIDIYFDTPDPMPNSALSLKNMGEIQQLFLRMYDIWNSKSMSYYSKSMSIFYEIITKIKNHNINYFTAEQFKKILPSYNYMLEHYTDKDFNYKKMCFQSNLSYDYFKELFIKQYGASPVKILTNMRIEKAKELLITGKYTITEIAQMCGFENVYYFSSVFKKLVGVSPSKF